LQIGGTVYWQDDVKTKASKATIRLPEEVLKVLQQVRAAQARNKLLLGEAYQDNNLVFCKADGTAYRPDFIYHRFKELLAANGLPAIPFHALRHTFCTMLLEQGEELSTVSKLARHSSYSITADTYGHLTKVMQDQASDTMDRILKGQAKK
jgi:integrase